MFVCLRVCVRTCMRACVRGCVGSSVRASVHGRLSTGSFGFGRVVYVCLQSEKYTL